MQYYETPQNLSKEQVLSDFNMLMQNVDHVYEARLIGGEPFMNKDIYDIIAQIVKSEKISKVVIYSNAMIPFREEGISILKNPKVILSLTDYGDLAKTTHRNVSKLDEAEIPYRLHPPENWTDSGIIKNFERTLEENEEIFQRCCGKNLLTLSNGKIYRCPFAANADRLNAIPLNTENYIFADSSSEEIRRYTRKIKALPACNFCKGRSFNAPQIKPAIQTSKPLIYKQYKLIEAGQQTIDAD
jgi:sulfatase maturation enzyme AslB (radical SAM superfamily)